jgi:outer membrane protein OmpA-like peptidoglycan-associated protein
LPKDSDRDGVVDESDACPKVSGVSTDNPATNGCPRREDSDADGVFDDEDACRDKAGPTNTDPAKNGCPIATVEENQIIILERVEFENNQATLQPTADKVLNAVLEVLKSHPEISSLRVEGHTDARGIAANNLKLSQQRAKAVVDWLVARGIDAKRLTSQGYGQSKPIDSNETDAGRQNNRRVEFHIDNSGSTSEKVVQ